jgi:mono/diheme cytochrome c family protein
VQRVAHLVEQPPRRLEDERQQRHQQPQRKDDLQHDGDRRQRGGKRVGHALALLVALALAGCGDSGPAPSERPGEDLSGPERRGAELVTQTGCLACHRLHGEGADKPGSDLTGIGARRSEAQLRKSLLDPPLPMPPYTSLPEEDIDALVAYLASRR